MAGTTPLVGLPYPSPTTDAPNGPAQIQSLANAVESRTIPRFANNTARNTAFAAWVAAGNTMVDGLHCNVAGIDQVYRGGSWRGTTTTSFSTGSFFQTTIGGTDNTEYGVSSLTIPDPGFPYIIEVFAIVMVAADSGTQATMRCHLDSATGTSIGVNIVRSAFFPAGETLPLVTPGFESGVLTGSHSVIITMQRTQGSGSWTVPGVGNFLKAIVRPA